MSAASLFDQDIRECHSESAHHYYRLQPIECALLARHLRPTFPHIYGCQIIIHRRASFLAQWIAKEPLVLWSTLTDICSEFSVDTRKNRKLPADTTLKNFSLDDLRVLIKGGPVIPEQIE